MCPIEEAYNTLEFKDFFIIKPVISFNNRSKKWNILNYENPIWEKKEKKLVMISHIVQIKIYFYPLIKSKNIFKLDAKACVS